MPQPQKILIVDDEAFNVDYLQQELDDAGCTTDVASNGQEALSKVKGEPPDLILLDIMMPIMDGFEVLTNLKADPKTRDIPVIIISASNDLQSVVKGITLGAEEYLPKPFEPVLLHARVASCLEKKALHDLQQQYLAGLERELKIAAEIQQGFLPAELPTVEGWDVAISFRAAREVAGDFYDSYLLPDGNIVVVIGDVCGKGVGAALFMTLFRSLIRATSTTDYFYSTRNVNGFPPQERLHHVLKFTNDYVAITHGEANMFATVFLGIIDPKSGSLTYANCGNEPPILLTKSGAFHILTSTGPVVGVIPETDFSVKEISMEPGSLLLAFTDGIPDAVNQRDIPFGREPINELLHQPMSSCSSLLHSLEERISEFTKGIEQFDDITALAIMRS